MLVEYTCATRGLNYKQQERGGSWSPVGFGNTYEKFGGISFHCAMVRWVFIWRTPQETYKFLFYFRLDDIFE